MALKKISDLIDAGAVTDDDYFVITNDPLGTPVSRRLNADDLQTYAQTGVATDYVAPAVVTGTTDTLDADDHGVTIRYTNASQVTVTIPTDASDDLPDGFWCMLFAEGAAGVTLSTAGVTLAGSSPNTTIAQNEAMIVQKTATANTWIVLGATAA